MCQNDTSSSNYILTLNVTIMRKVLLVSLLVFLCSMVFAQSNTPGIMEKEGFLGYLTPSSFVLDNGKKVTVSTSVPIGYNVVLVEAPPFFYTLSWGNQLTLEVNEKQLLVWNDGYEGSQVEFPVTVLVEAPSLRFPYGKYFMWKIYWQS